MEWPSTRSIIVRDIAQAQNSEAWNSFVDIYGPLIHRLCLSHGLQSQDAADVVQNVLVRVWRAASRFDFSRGRFRNWLITITTHEVYRCRKRIRQGMPREEKQLTLEQIAHTLTAAWMTEYQVRVFECAYEQVRRATPALEWRAFELLWVEQQKGHQVAAETEKSLQWVYRNKQQVLRSLRQAVESLETQVEFPFVNASANQMSPA